jgi:hypothetical protein
VAVRSAGATPLPIYEWRRRSMSKKVSIEINLDALQDALGEWPGVEEVATRLDKTSQHIHNMLADGSMKGVRTSIGWIVHPACVERVAREEERQMRLMGGMSREDLLEGAKMRERRLKENTSRLCEDGV